jgi:Cft2 family RNA processing exonuclease
MHPLALEMTADGLYVPALDLHLDPRRAVRRAFVSHAHADHTGGRSGGEVLASPETAALVAARAGAPLNSLTALGWSSSRELPLLATHGGGTARLSIAPAGHVLGAAQLVIDHPGGRVVYTGDYQTGPGLTHADGAPVPCDQLVIESTFALPIFAFPDRARVRASLVAWCAARLAEGLLPVVLAYALGKSQEVVRALLDGALPVVAHGAVYRVCEAYEALGVDLGIEDGRVLPYAEQKKNEKRGKRLEAVVVAPPSAFAHPMVKGRPNVRVAYVSGWALLDASIDQHRADAGFPLSDHGDHDDLVATVHASGARLVYTTLGDAEALAGFVARRGVDAVALAAPSLDVAEDVASAALPTPPVSAEDGAS